MAIAQHLNAHSHGLAETRRGTGLGSALPLSVALAVNWYAAAQLQHPLFAWTSLLLFAWLLALVLRWSTAGFILLLPITITRGATMLSLAAIEAGAYMPEINQPGHTGDASASFVAFTTLFFVTFAIVFRMVERPALAHARSPLMERAVALLAWPVLLVCMVWGAAAVVSGLQTGFPLLQGLDRFFYRSQLSSPLVFILLDNKFLVAALLGAIAFAPQVTRMLRMGAVLTFLMLTGVYFLFGDKFFTILGETTFFAMPGLLLRREQLGRTLLRCAPLAIGVVCLASAASIYIYSGYGRLPLDRTTVLLGERIAGQGQLWFIATRDAPPAAHWDGHLVAAYTDGLGSDDPAHAAFVNGVETHWFIQRYSPAKLADSFRKNGGWVQLVMGTEAMGLVMFGYAGVMAIMLIGGVVLALAAAYLLRAFASGFPLSLFFAVWTYLQVYFAMQQASLWPVAADGQVKRLLLFLTIELVLLTVNRAQIFSGARRARSLPPRRSKGLQPA